MSVEVVRVEVTRAELSADDVPELRELFRLERLPLAPARVSVELRGVPTAVVNALRRVVTDEMPGRALEVPADGFSAETTDPFMLPQFVNGRVAAVRLRPQIGADVVASLRLRLDVTNRGAAPLAVYAGDFEVVAGAMPDALFNPTTKLAVLQPGKRLVIEGVRIATGFGRDNGVFNVACRAAYTHLDLPQHDDAATRLEGGVAVDESGYRVSCLVADPRHHRLTATLPATTADLGAVRAVFADACANIKERLRLVAAAVDRRPGPADAAAREPRGAAPQGHVLFTVIPLEGGLVEGLLQVPGETHTVGELLRRTVFEMEPGISFVAYTVVAHENRLTFTVRHTDDVTRVVSRAVQHAIATFDTIQRGFGAAR